MWSNAHPAPLPYPPPPNYYQPSVPTYQPPVDPFRNYYASRLRELTSNIRNLIQSLSVMAMDQRDTNSWNNMQAVVEEIENAVYQSAPHEKLPKLYLIDSISKNVGAPYTTHLLPPIIPRLYLRTYREVDGVTKSKMEEMIGLWRSSGPNGTDLYGVAVREQVEREIFGSMGYQQQTLPSRDKVMATMRDALTYHHRESANRPWDQQASQNLHVLQQLNVMLTAGALPPAELQQIMDKLTAMAPKPTPQPTYGNVTPMAPPPIVQPPTPTLPPFPPNIRNDYRVPSGGFPLPQPAPIPPVSTPVPTPVPPSAIPSNVLDILRNLNSSGALSAPRTPEPPIVSAPRTKIDDYEDTILKLDVKLSEINLNQNHTIPLAHLPERCTQCFQRFPERGPKFEAHMDWHFRRNKQERQSGGRGAHRRWLPRGEEWVNDIPTIEAGPSTVPTEAPKNKLSVEQLRKRWVRVPSDPVKAAQPCPICKEAFKSEWAEDEEAWIWKNAVEVNGKTIYHAICRSEFLENRALAKVRAGGTSRSLSKSKSPGHYPSKEEVKSDLKPSIPQQAPETITVPNSSTPANEVATAASSTKEETLPTQTTDPPEVAEVVGIKRKISEDDNGDDSDSEAKRMKMEEELRHNRIPEDEIQQIVAAIQGEIGLGQVDELVGDEAMVDNIATSI